MTVSKGIRKRWSDISFKEEMARRHPQITLLGVYINYDTPILARCKTCGNDRNKRNTGPWAPRPYNLLGGGHGCPKCGVAATAEGKKRTAEKAFFKRFAAKGAPLILLSSYNGGTNNIQYLCKQCGHIGESSANNLAKGQGCNGCKFERIAKQHKMPESAFLKRLVDNNPRLICLNPQDYRNVNTYLRFKCHDCEGIFESPAGYVARGITHCTLCSEGGGYRDNKPGVFYWIDLDTHIGIGISNKFNSRRANHIRNLRNRGIYVEPEAFHTISFDDGRIPRQIENAILRTLPNNIGLPIMGFVREAVEKKHANIVHDIIDRYKVV